jgi:hypothetical protein
MGNSQLNLENRKNCLVYIRNFSNIDQEILHEDF